MTSVHRRTRRCNTNPPRSRGATVVHVPGGLLLSVADPDRAELVAERLCRFIPARARHHDAARDVWVVVRPFDRTAYYVALVTCGTVLRAFRLDYADGLRFFERAGQAERRAA